MDQPNEFDYIDFLVGNQKILQDTINSLHQFENVFKRPSQEKHFCKTSTGIFSREDSDDWINEDLNEKTVHSNQMMTLKRNYNQEQKSQGDQIYFNENSQEQQEQKVQFKQIYKTKQIVKEHKDSIKKHKGSIKIQKEQRLSDDKKTKKNQYDTKNLLAFFWTKTVNFLNERQEIKNENWWTQIKDKTGSLVVFSSLFNQSEEKRQIIKLIFDKRHYFQTITMSAISKQNKKLYIKYINKLQMGFHSKEIKYLN